MICRVELASDLSAFTDSSGWEGRSSMTELIKACEELAAIQFIEAALFQRTS
jgi:hypothetical protein